jgi:anaerobic magnesium-protoporphyrin IX monomethyl ester cyclase
LLCVGGPLIDDGHEVSLLDGEFGPMSTEQLVREAMARAPDAVLFGHSGSSSGHPVIAEVSAAIARALPGAHIVYGGVHPTYFWREILAREPHVCAVVRGEGEETARRLIGALGRGEPLDRIDGIAFRRDGEIVGTRAGAENVRWSSNFPGVARTCATIAGKGVSGRAGGIAIRSGWRRKSRGFTAIMGSRCSTSRMKIPVLAGVLGALFWRR